MNLIIKGVVSMKYFNYLKYNSFVILTYFFLSLIVLILKNITNRKTNNLFTSGRDSILNPLTYIRMFTHILGHTNYNHFKNNFLYILLIGPMIEEKYGSINLLIMILITSFITALINIIISNKNITGASGIVYMLILLSSMVNLEAGKIPITLILIFVFYILTEIKDGLFKKDNISHLSHLIGAITGFIYGFIYF